MLIGTGVMLGLSIPIAKAASAAGVPALAYALWPTALAALVLAGMATRRHGPLRPSLPLLRYASISGFLGHAAPMTATFWVSAQAGAGVASLAFTLTPVTTLAISAQMKTVGAKRSAKSRPKNPACIAMSLRSTIGPTTMKAS